MSSLIRTGISLDRELLARFDRIAAQKGYGSRSEAIRDLVRECAVSTDVARDRVVVGTLTVVYDHHRPGLTEELIAAQHHYHGKVLATTAQLDRFGKARWGLSRS